MADNNIELRTERIQELLGSAPNKLTRYGITVFFGVIAALLIFCAFFRYPETYKAAIVITAEHPAAWVVAQSSGKLDTILIKNSSFVRKGELLAVIHNTANVNDIFLLGAYLDSLSGFMTSFDTKEMRLCDKTLQLGELQDSYMQLYKVMEEYNFFRKEDFHKIREQAISTELNEYKNYLNIVKNQSSLRQEAGQLVHNKYNRDSILFSMSGISATEFEKTKQQYLYDNIDLRQSQLSIASTNITINKLNQSLLESNNEYRGLMSSYAVAMSTAYEQLKSRLDAWSQAYLLKSPVDGTVNFLSVWGKDQYVSAGDKSFVIVPADLGDIIGRCKFAVNGSGKIKPGQEVTIKLDEYPYMEFGMLKGTVKNISAIPVEVMTPVGVEKTLLSEISLRKGFTSTYGKEIPFVGELSGSAEITIQNMTLLEHFISPLKHLWKNNLE